ncbi:alpha/beta hydrolase [Crossiella sp. SN42]|uniref:alpha/beta hydrolase n=1 Tax=Crossiella sp. SN42 TaxID=2944808 RepID=UPI00207C51DB|nr:alpha/beta hydrolase [Crossiella sp. SN42]MCO1578066.1 alpha/beta hydrolase [Crossiella sp. SN42]
MSRKRLLLVLPVLLAGVATTTPALAAGIPLNSTGIPDRFAGQSLSWRPCTMDDMSAPLPDDLDITGLECATFRTPRDWAWPSDEPELTIAISRLPATGKATASLFTNPGGPGGPGRWQPGTELRAHQEIIGMDPRGTGKSDNISCGGVVPGAGRDGRDRSPANLAAIADSVREFAQACQRHSGELGKYIDTAQTIRDMDLLRVLLGRQKINYYGISGGTWLGPHYAQQFPRRTGRFVVDSVVEFTGDWQTFRDSQAASFERRWRQDFLPWIAQYESRYRFGATGEQARRVYEDLRAELARKPVEIGGGLVNQLALDGAVVHYLYKKKNFPLLADLLVSARAATQGRSTPAPSQALAADFFTATLWSTLCNDTPWTGDRESIIRRSQENFDRGHLILGASWLTGQACVFWQRPQGQIPLQQLTGKGVPPVLIVHSEHDGATGIENAIKARQNFRGARMITVTGEGDHGLYADGNARLDRAVERFLVHGKPPVDARVPGMPLPVPAG